MRPVPVPLTTLLSVPLLALALVLAWAAPCRAHPHVFVDNHATFVFDEDGLIGFRLTWLFDDMFGSTIIQDYDADRDGAFDAAETARLKAEVFDNLRNYDWFVHLRVDGAPVRVTQVYDFAAHIDDGRLRYAFTVPCDVPAGGEEHTLLLSVRDDTYYADVQSPSDPAPALAGAKGYAARTRVELNDEQRYSSYQAWTPEIHLTFRRR